MGQFAGSKIETAAANRGLLVGEAANVHFDPSVAFVVKRETLCDLYGGTPSHRVGRCRSPSAPLRVGGRYRAIRQVSNPSGAVDPR
jgi:hypothetical protein